MLVEHDEFYEPGIRLIVLLEKYLRVKVGAIRSNAWSSSPI